MCVGGGGGVNIAVEGSNVGRYHYLLSIGAKLYVVHRFLEVDGMENNFPIHVDEESTSLCSNQACIK